MKKKSTSFAKYAGREEFDWNKFLRKRKYTLDELEKAQDLAGSWVTCACGNQCSIIPRSSFDDAPLDDTLNRLGMSFYDHIEGMFSHYRNTDNFKLEKGTARVVLEAIEKRSAYLIKKIKKTNKKSA